MTALEHLVGQDDVVTALTAAAKAAHGDVAAPAGAMTHAWLFTGPAGSGRSTAAGAFAAALQCPARGCGECADCRTVAAGTHPGVRRLATAGLSIKVEEARALRRWMAEVPPEGQWRIAIVEDADRMTPGAAAALLKVVEEPPARGVFLLCSPSTHEDDIPVTIRSRCRTLVLKAPRSDRIAGLLVDRDGVDPPTATWAAEVSGGHVGRARVLASDEAARRRRETAVRAAFEPRRIRECYEMAQSWLTEASSSVEDLSERFDAEKSAWAAALGTDAASRRAARSGARTSAAVIREVEDRQRLESKRAERDALDLMLADLAGFYRDVLMACAGADVVRRHPDHRSETETAARRWGPQGALRRLNAVLEAGVALEAQAKPQIVLDALMLDLHVGKP